MKTSGTFEGPSGARALVLVKLTNRPSGEIAGRPEPHAGCRTNPLQKGSFTCNPVEATLTRVVTCVNRS